MSERARILAWWGYVLCVVAIFEIVFLRAGFAYAVLAALASIVVLGSLLKFLVNAIARRARARPGSPRSTRSRDSEDQPPGEPI